MIALQVDRPRHLGVHFMARSLSGPEGLTNRWLPANQEELQACLPEQGLLAKVIHEALQSGIGPLDDEVNRLTRPGREGMDFEKLLEEINQHLVRIKLAMSVWSLGLKTLKSAQYCSSRPKSLAKTQVWAWLRFGVSSSNIRVGRKSREPRYVGVVLSTCGAVVVFYRA